MLRNQIFRIGSAHIAGTLAVLVVLFFVGSDCFAQGAAVNTNITLDRGTPETTDDWLIFPFVAGDNAAGLGFAADINASAMYLRTDSPSGALSLTANGVGVGLSGFTTDADTVAQAALHVMGGGGASAFQTTSAFPTARVLVEDRNTDSGLRELLRLKNNGGSNIVFEDTSEDGSQFKVENVIGLFEIASGPVQFRINSAAPDNIFNINESGVGIGIQQPETSIHVLADGVSSDLGTANIRLEVTNGLPAASRNMMQITNNGPIIQTFTDTSSATPGIYQMVSATDRFSIQQLGGQRAGMAMFDDGAIRFVADGVPNFTVTGAGNLNVVGSAPGGGNMNVGLGENIGADDGNLFVKRNIVYGGELQGPSDVNSKENFEEIDAKEVLRKVADLPITRWNYISDEGKTSHVGPMAQDFKAAFQVGTSEKHISMMDSDGVSLAAIKGLSQIVDDKEKTIARQAAEIEKLNVSLREHSKSLAQQSKTISELSEGLKRVESMVGTGSSLPQDRDHSSHYSSKGSSIQ